MSRIAFIGLGNMGGPMAGNLQRNGHALTVFDLSESACAALAARGASVAASARAAVDGAEFVVSMLPAGKHVSALYTGEAGLLEVLGPQTTVMDCSTIDAPTAREVGAAAAARGIGFLDAPVSGGVAAATAGTLAFMCGGAPETFARARPVLADMGRNIFHAGPAGAGQVAKACNNLLLAIHMLGTCEALELGARNGLDPAVLSEIMLASSGRNWSLEVYNPWPGVMPGAPAGNDYRPGFALDLMVKDLGLAQALAEQVGLDNPMGQQALARYQARQAAGEGGRDFSVVMQALRPTAD